MPLFSSLAAFSEWLHRQRYRQSAIAEFLEDADYYLVAQALAYGHVIVTHEVVSDGVRYVKIPNVAIGMRVKCMTPYEMLRLERARFILERAP